MIYQLLWKHRVFPRTTIIIIISMGLCFMELKGKNVLFLGSSVTCGVTRGISFAEIMAQRCGITYVKETFCSAGYDQGHTLEMYFDVHVADAFGKHCTAAV